MVKMRLHRSSVGVFISQFGDSSVPDPKEERRRLRALQWAVLKQDRSLPHLWRRFYHALMGFVCFSLYAWVLDRDTACWLLVAIGGPFVLLDLLRLQSKSLKKMALTYFAPLMRRNELLGLTGNSFFIFGLITVVLFFSKPIALLSILYLAIGDPVAAYVGSRYGTRRLVGKKTLEGAVANFAASGLASLLFAVLYTGTVGSVWVIGFLGGLVSMLAELVPFPVDDNFSVPVLAGLQLTLVQQVYPLF